MAKITRYNGNFKAFGSDATGTERTVFGSTTQTDDLTTNLGAEYQRGWGVLPSGQKPPKQYFNGALFGTSQAVAYLHQAGVAEWNGEQEYHAGSITNRNGQIFVCLTDDHVSASAPETDSTNWRLDDGSVATISALLNRTTVGTVNVLNYHTGLEGGGGVFYWDASKPKAEHNGGTVIDPTVTFPSDWNNQTQLTNWFTAGSSGTGCWVRQYDGAVNVNWFGAKGDGVTDDTKAVQKTIDTNVLVELPDNFNAVISSTLYIQRGSKGIVGCNSLYDSYVDVSGVSGSGFIYTGTYTCIEFRSQDTSNATVPSVMLSNFGIRLTDSYQKGIDYRHATYSSFTNIYVRLLGGYSTGFYAVGNSQGSAPYYNKFDGCSVFGNNDDVNYPSQVGFYSQGDGAFMADGANANIYTNTRHLVGLKYGFIFESGVGNIISNTVFESISDTVFLFGSDATASEGRSSENLVIGAWGEGTSTAKLVSFSGASAQNTVTNFSINSVSNVLYTDTTALKRNKVTRTGDAQIIVFSGQLPTNSVVPVSPTSPNWASLGYGGVTPSVIGYPILLAVNTNNISGSIVGSAVVRVYRSGIAHPVLMFTITDSSKNGIVYNIGGDLSQGYNLFDGTLNSSAEVVVTTSADWNQPNAVVTCSLKIQG